MFGDSERGKPDGEMAVHYLCRSPNRVQRLECGAARRFSAIPQANRSRHLLFVISRALLFAVAASYGQSPPDKPAVQVIELPPLDIEGKAASAHTQGLEVLGDDYYVTARREDVRPKRALLAHTTRTGTNWNSWDLTPSTSDGSIGSLDHPGGFQSDGQHLWIPIAESKPKSRSIIRAFSIAGLKPGKSAKFDFEFTVQDHIGAVAVETTRGWLLGANWDTESVYVWDLEGKLKQTLSGPSLTARRLGLAPDTQGRAGIAVQDWKFVSGQLFASGLAAASPNSRRSHLLVFTNFLGGNLQSSELPLPTLAQIEFAREAMAVVGNWIYFLPEDLAVSNRLFRFLPAAHEP